MRAVTLVQHITALMGILKSVSKKIPHKKLWGVFFIIYFSAIIFSTTPLVIGPKNPTAGEILFAF